MIKCRNCRSKNEIIKMNIYTSDKKQKIFSAVDQFEKMFYTIQKKYQKNSFQNFHAKKIRNQLDLLVSYNI